MSCEADCYCLLGTTYGTTAAKSEGTLYRIKALTPVWEGRRLKTDALTSASGMVDLGPDRKIHKDPLNFLRNLKVGPHCAANGKQVAQNQMSMLAAFVLLR